MASSQWILIPPRPRSTGAAPHAWTAVFPAVTKVDDNHATWCCQGSIIVEGSENPATCPAGLTIYLNVHVPPMPCLA